MSGSFCYSEKTLIDPVICVWYEWGVDMQAAQPASNQSRQCRPPWQQRLIEWMNRRWRDKHDDFHQLPGEMNWYRVPETTPKGMPRFPYYAEEQQP